MGLDERIVYGDDVDVVMLDGVSIDNPPNSSEAVDSDASRHFGENERMLGGKM